MDKRVDASSSCDIPFSSIIYSREEFLIVSRFKSLDKFLLNFWTGPTLYARISIQARFEFNFGVSNTYIL